MYIFFSDSNVHVNNAIGRISNSHKHYRISFNLQLLLIPGPSLIPIKELIIGFTVNDGPACCSIGEHTPGFYIENGNNFAITLPINGSSYLSSATSFPISLKESYNVTLEQVPVGEEIYNVTWYINGQMIENIQNALANDYENMIVYQSDPVSVPSSAIVTDLQYESFPSCEYEQIIACIDSVTRL